MAMVPVSRGMPPPSRMPYFTCSASSRMCMWPGTISLKELITATKGFFMSSSSMPVA